MAQTSDFFFGEYVASNNRGSISLDQMLPLADKVSGVFFTSQLNRFLQLNSGRISLHDGTSQPSFFELIDKIDDSSIGYIEIYARTDVNSSVRATLACDIFLEHGVVSVTPHWATHQDIRADEVIATLLVPLHLKGLHAKSFVRTAASEPKRLLCPVLSNYEDEIRLVFDVSGYPMVSHVTEEGRQRLNRNARDLEAASQVGQKGLSGEAAYDAFRELCETMPIAGR